MGFVVLRTQKLKSKIAIRRSLTHALRGQPTPNADPDRTPDNTVIGASSVDEVLAIVDGRLATQDKIRSNAVLAVEYLVTGSPEVINAMTREGQDKYFDDAMKWLKEKHGTENVVFGGIHRDEITPHLYAYVVPIDSKGKLNCRAFLGGSKALNGLQTDFARDVGNPHGLERGIEGSKAQHVSIQRYYARVNAPYEQLPEIKTVVPKLRVEPEKPSLWTQVTDKGAKEAWVEDAQKWRQERSAVRLAREQHKLESDKRSAAAVAAVKRLETQVRELAALKIEVVGLKRANGGYAKQAQELTAMVDVANNRAQVDRARLNEVADLFTPAEIAAAKERQLNGQLERYRAAEYAKANKARAEELARTDADRKTLERIRATKLAEKMLEIREAEEARAAAAPRVQERTWLAVPFADKDVAQVAGCRWDKEAKRWFAPVGTELAGIAKWVLKPVEIEIVKAPERKPSPSRDRGGPSF